MRIKNVTVAILGTALVVAFAVPAMAQARPTTAPASSSMSSGTANGQLSIGYSFLHIDTLNAPAGFDANFTKDVTTMSMGSVGYLIDFGVNHGSLLGTSTVIDGGARINFKTSGKATFYGLVTLGLAHAETVNNFVIDFGGGADVPLQGKNFGAFAQVDFPVVMFNGGSRTGIRLGGGITITLNMK